MCESTSPRRFRFGLRTLFVVVLIAAVPCGWVAYSLSWIRQRHELLGGGNSRIMLRYVGMRPYPDAPWGLWLLGEEGVGFILLRPEYRHIRERMQRMFPEAEVTSQDEPAIPGRTLQ